MKIPVTYLLTCEHAGNNLPAAYVRLFKGKEEALFTHKALDFGALKLARHLAGNLKLALYYVDISRLLVEANRSLDNAELFSEYSQKLTRTEKQAVLETCYFPHRNEVESAIGQEIAAGNQVVHLAIHTFTPVLEGEVRKNDIGILFDPGRTLEKEFAAKLKDALKAENAGLKVTYNSPYPGTDDGLPTYLRKVFAPEKYAGFEIEVNQKFFLSGEPEVWEQLQSEITRALRSAMK